MEDIESSFSVIDKVFKKFDETRSYAELNNSMIRFNSEIVELKSVDDVDRIIAELNCIPRKMFMYGMILESQSQVLQKLEDEFDLWKAKKLHEIDKSKFKSEKAKDDYVKVEFEEEYKAYTNQLSTEQYNLGIMKRVVSALESYSFKLHSILTYKQKILEKVH